MTIDELISSMVDAFGAVDDPTDIDTPHDLEARYIELAERLDINGVDVLVQVTRRLSTPGYMNPDEVPFAVVLTAVHLAHRRLERYVAEDGFIGCADHLIKTYRAS